MKIKDLKVLLQNYDENLEIKLPTGYEDDEQSNFSDIKNIRDKNGILYLSSLSDETYNNIKYRHENTLNLLQDLQLDFYKCHPDEHCCILEKYWSYDDDFTYYFYTSIKKYSSEFYKSLKSKLWDRYDYTISFDKLDDMDLINRINLLRQKLDLNKYHLCFEYEYEEDDIKILNISHNSPYDLSSYFDKYTNVRYDSFNNVKINGDD